MSKTIPFLERILKGKKTIESRWYSQRRTPWDKVQVGDWIYFKNVGEAVSAKALVAKVEQREFSEPREVVTLITSNATALGLTPGEVDQFIEKVKTKKYGIFINLMNVTAIHPFTINKQGFGAMAAWLTLDDVNTIRQEIHDH